MIKKQPNSRIGTFFSLFPSEKRWPDQLFFILFYICVGLLPPLIGIFGHKAVQLPLTIISTLIILRFFLNDECRMRMTRGVRFPAAILLTLFAVLTAFSGVVDVMADPDRMRILGKPAVFLLIAVVMIFVSSHRDIINSDLIFKLLFAGVVTGLTITILKIVVSHKLGIGYPQDSNALTHFININDPINDFLKIESVLVFTAVLGFSSLTTRYALLVAMLTTILIASNMAVGFWENGAKAIVLKIDSETVQFGMPIALLVLAIAYKAPRIMTNFVFSTMAFVLVSAPWLFQVWYWLIQQLPLPKARKFLVRGEIWDGVAKTILESPFWGFGIDSARYLKHIDLKNDYMPEDDIHHPHNMVLQLWLDLGFSGVAIVVGLLYLGWRFINRLKLDDRPPILAGLVMLSVFTLVSHSIWQTWSLALITFFMIYVYLSMKPVN